MHLTGFERQYAFFHLKKLVSRTFFSVVSQNNLFSHLSTVDSVESGIDNASPQMCEQNPQQKIKFIIQKPGGRVMNVCYVDISNLKNIYAWVVGSSGGMILISEMVDPRENIILWESNYILEIMAIFVLGKRRKLNSTKSHFYF